MTEQNWEYCELRLLDWKEHGLLGLSGRGYDCSIKYYVYDENEINIQLTEMKNILPYNPFEKAMAFLGANGWELVSIQYGNAHGDPGSYSHESIIWANRVAFLKRPIVIGRKVNEPELKL